MLLFLNDVLDDAQKHRGHIIIRKQHCLTCSTVLAVEITDKLGRRGKYWVAKSALWTPYGMDILYDEEVWFGNLVKCFKCGRQGRLPGDKPLNAEAIALPKEIKDGNKNQNLSAAKA